MDVKTIDNSGNLSCPPSVKGRICGQVYAWCKRVSGLAQGDKLCEICRQPYKGPYRDPPSKPAPVQAGPAAAALRGATLMPQSLVQMAMSHRAEVSTAAACLHACRSSAGNPSAACTLALQELCLCLYPAGGAVLDTELRRQQACMQRQASVSLGGLLACRTGRTTRSMAAQPGAP